MHLSQLKYAPPSDEQLRKQKLLKDLFMWQSPYCRCCGTRLTTQVPQKGKKEPDNLATIEHVYPSTDLRRYTANGGRFMTLFCKKCNCDKGQLDSPHSIQLGYEKDFPAFDIRSLIPIQRPFSDWIHRIIRHRKTKNKKKPFNIHYYR